MQVKAEKERVKKEKRDFYHLMQISRDAATKRKLAKDSNVDLKMKKAKHEEWVNSMS